MEQKPLMQLGSLIPRTFPANLSNVSLCGATLRRRGRVRRGCKAWMAMLLLAVVSTQSAHADIVDQFNTLGQDVEAWANILIPTVIVFAFIAVIFYVVTSSPRWRGALAVFVVALILWGGLDEIVTWAHKIGGGDGTVNIVGGGGGNGGGDGG